MTSTERTTGLTDLARVGFSQLAEAAAGLEELSGVLGVDRAQVAAPAAHAADPDAALQALLRIARRDSQALRAPIADGTHWENVWRLLGASRGFGEFYARHPDELAALVAPAGQLPNEADLRAALLASVGARDGFADEGSEHAWVRLRICYRTQLARIALFDLSQPAPEVVLDAVAAALADAAGAALEASLCVARTRIATGGAAGQFSRENVAATRFAIIGMGKCGARELNYVSDVDVIFVAGVDEDAELSESRAVDIGTRLAVQTMRGVSSVEIEPPLWDVDPNLRPEGKQGALVRTLESHVSYYERWAKSWEFQALLKARPIAGDSELGDAYIAAIQPRVWASAGRENFVDSVQRMRERVTDHIPADEVAQQIKLGPGGIRDVEFTVQLLQLVHGLSDEAIRQRGTLAALDALMTEGYISRTDAAAFARDYRLLRLLEHRLQLRRLSRTHLMPTDPDELRVLARATGLADTGDGLLEQWDAIKREVREIHVRVFYRPLLSAVAALPADERALSEDQAHDRLAAIGFLDPPGALRHIRALTSGLSRKVTIQRHLMPVMIRWFADGVDPDYGLVSFRRLSERLGDTPWFLRMLRDSTGAAERLTRVLSGSRYVGELMEWIPESAAWLDHEEHLRPRSGITLQQEARAIQTRHRSIDDAARAVRALRRREVLRTAMGGILGIQSIEDIATSLTTITEVTIQATLRAVRREVVPPEDDALDFSVIAMGRFGGAELGFGSDADVLYVYRPNGIDDARAAELSRALVAGLRQYSEDQRLPLDLDAGLRPEGRNGPIVRSLDAYTAYYERWSLSWEAQALLRSRGVAGSVKLITAFAELADRVRYPASADPAGLREIKRIKARVENERLPQGVDPARHLKLGPGSLSNVEWLVQLLQLQHAHAVPALQTTSTLGALDALVAEGILPESAGERLRSAWMLASRLRSANTLLSGQTSDVLPTDRRRLDGLARLLEYPPHSASQVEEDYLGTTRRARRVFEKYFYG